MMTKHVDSDNSHKKITAAGVCLMVAGKGTDPATTLLYLRHGDEPSLKDSLSIPCGGVQHDEEPFSAAVRELYEECMPNTHRAECSFEKFKSDLKGEVFHLDELYAQYSLLSKDFPEKVKYSKRKELVSEAILSRYARAFSPIYQLNEKVQYEELTPPVGFTSVPTMDAIFRKSFRLRKQW
jgi:hypothetical protein